MRKIKILKNLTVFGVMFSMIFSMVFATSFSAIATTTEEESETSEITAEETITGTVTSSTNQMLHFIMRVRWGNVISEPTNTEEANFDGSIDVTDSARMSLERSLLFEKHNETADKITGRTDPVSWNSLIYGHWDGVKVAVSSPANDNVTITTSEGTVEMTARELYDLSEPYIQDVGEGREIVVKVYPVSENPNYFLKVFWGKIDRTGYNEKRCAAGIEGTAKCWIPLLNADGSFKIDSGGTLGLVRTLRFEHPDAINSQSDTEIDWTSRLYGGVDGILVNLKLNADELDKSDTVTINFNNSQSNFPKSYSLLDLYHDRYTEDIINGGYGVVFQVWKKPNRSLIRVKNKPTVYMVEDGVKQPIPSPEVLESQGLTFNDVEEVSQDEADTYGDGEATCYADGTVVQEEGKPEVYIIADGEKKHIENPTAFASLGYNWGNIVRVKQGVLGLYRSRIAMKAASVHPEGALIREAGNPTVYLVEGGKKKPITSQKIFNARRLNWNKVLVVNNAQMDKFQLGATLQYPDGAVVQDPAGKVYVMDQGKKRWVRSGDDLTGAGYNAADIISVKDPTEVNDLNAIDEGNDIVADDLVVL